MKKTIKNKYIVTNGSQAVAKSAFPFVEVACIFPITPSTEVSWTIRNRIFKGDKNIFGHTAEVFQYNSELGSAAGVHGALQNGILAVTCTASQGLLLMLPNIFKCCGEMLPSVMHVGSRSIAKRSLSIHGDHSDIYSVRQAGPILLSSNSVQDAHYKASIAHGIAVEASYPIIHFYDSEIANTIRKVEYLNESFYNKVLDKKSLVKFRERRLNPMNPVARGGHENGDTFFQSQEAQNTHINNIEKIALKYFKLLQNELKIEFAPFTYHGDKNAENIIIAMGSVTETIKETIADLNSKKHKYGLVVVHLYRPFLTKHLIKVLPKSVKNIAVLSKTKEPGSVGEPLYLDVVSSLVKEQFKFNKILNGRYGLSSKNTTPAQIKAVYENLEKTNSKHDFTIGICDDVTHLSLDVDNNYLTKLHQDTHSMLMFGIGGDGTISAAKTVGDIVANSSDYYIEIDKVHNSLKANNVTQSMIQLNKKPINSMYFAREFYLISCSLDTFLPRLNMVEKISQNGKFILNTTLNKNDVELILPNKYKKILADRKCKLYIVNATEIANKCGIPNKISMIMAGAVLTLNDGIHLTPTQAKKALIQNIIKLFTRKGEKVVNSNVKAIEMLESEYGLQEIKVDPSWSNVKYKALKKDIETYDDFVEDIEETHGDDIPVSDFIEVDNFSNVDGSIKSDNMTFKSKKRVNIETPRWLADKCIQCNRCALVCPHATIRAFLLSPEEIKKAPQKFETLYAVGAEGYQFRIQVDNENCVGCGLCAEVCPVDALEMVPSKEEQGKYTELTNYLYKVVEPKVGDFSTDTWKGAAFKYPYFEASGACAGCGETPYYRLLTQLFGKEMVIANATGCSSIYGGHVESPWAVDQDGHGPAWANSLFEDGAEYGLGMRLAEQYKVKKIKTIIHEEINNVEPKLKKLFTEFLKIYEDSTTRVRQRELRKEMIELIKKSKNHRIQELLNLQDSLVKKSMWIIGGDGWAFDIDFGGIRHALDSGENVNILVLDTETFSNTGGQISSGSSYPAGGKGNETAALRTEIGQMLLTHKNAYVSQVSMGMNPNQTIKAFKEAESYNGPSIVICYCPCISHGFNLVKHQLNEREAVLSGYWTIFRFDPRKLHEGENPLTIDYKRPDFSLIAKFLKPQLRFRNQFKLLHEKEIDKINLFTNYIKRNFTTLMSLSEVKFTKDEDFTKVIKEVFVDTK